MQLQQLRHVVALVEHRSLGRAAQSLGISQPALSKSLRRLESHLGVKPPRVAIETNALSFMRAMIMETDCLGYLRASTPPICPSTTKPPRSAPHRRRHARPGVSAHSPSRPSSP